MKNGLFITEEYLHTLLDRIETLKEEKEKLKEELKSKDYNYQEFRYLDESNDILKKELEETEDRIDKAIEYINNYMPNYDFDHYNLAKLLKILKGENNE